jgi:hypothetical protein
MQTVYHSQQCFGIYKGQNINNLPLKQCAIEELQMYYSNELIFFPHDVTFVVNNPQFYNHMTSNIFSA